MSESEIKVALGRIEEKIDGLSEVRADHEIRIRSLEKTQWLRTGAISVISLVMAWMARPFFTP